MRPSELAFFVKLCRRVTRRSRTALALLLISAGCATGLIAFHVPSEPSAAAGPDNLRKVARNKVAGNERAVPGPETGRGPSRAAEEEYANRAYPASDIPFTVTKKATADWNVFAAENLLRGVGVPILNWTLVGPSAATFPGVLAFSGATYVASGRVTALVVDPSCSASGPCRVWIAAAGGGVWRTTNALDATPNWTFLSGSFPTNAIGRITYDAPRNTLYVGTGEPNASADSEAGLGIYKSTDGGDTWTRLAANTNVPAGSGVDCTAVGLGGGMRTAQAYSGPAFDGRAIGAILIDPNDANIMYVGSVRAIRGVSSVLSGGTVSLAPGLPPYGMWKSTDGGANFTLLNAQDTCVNPATAGDGGIVQASFGSTRGVHLAALDPSNPNTIYAAPFPQNNAVPVNTKGGVWRSTDAGATWTQIKTAQNANFNTDRASFAVTRLPSGATRMYVGVGNSADTDTNNATCPGGNCRARVYRSDDVATGTPVFVSLTDAQQASAAPNQTIGYCATQCWYDNIVWSPPGKPDVVYVGGSYDYNNYGGRSNGRAFLRSQDAGATFTDMTWDATSTTAPNGMHPDSHAVGEVPGTDRAIFGSDGGIIRSSGAFADRSSDCSARGLSGANLATCQQLLSRIPTVLTHLNEGLSTLQFQSLSVDPTDSTHLQGGTQDNGTFESYNSMVWPGIMYGDGGQSGFSSTNRNLRFNTFTGNAHDVNFQNGDPTKWVVASGPIVASGESAQFYSPIIADPSPNAARTIFQGSLSVWRTQNWGGPQAYLEANCAEFTTSAANPACGDFVRIGPPGLTNLTSSSGSDFRGTTRSGGNIAHLGRASSDTATLWVATTTGRLFVSKNADAPNALVTFTRIDTLASNSPGRFISGIAVNPRDPHQAWVSYSGYSTLTPTTPGHIFSVRYDPIGGGATWTNLDGAGSTMFPDFPATAMAVAPNGDLYAANDFGVLRRRVGGTAWEVAGTGLPMVEVAGLTIAPDGTKIFAATHGRSAWVANLPNDCSVCHKGQNIVLPCNSLEYRRHLDHNDRGGACMAR